MWVIIYYLLTKYIIRQLYDMKMYVIIDIRMILYISAIFTIYNMVCSFYIYKNIFKLT